MAAIGAQADEIDTVIMLDTHIAVALYEGRTAGVQASTRRAIDREPATISPAVLLELELLHEIGRLRVGALPIARYLGDQLAIRIAGERFADVATEALSLGFTRDPFDRLIVAHAALLRAPLVTLDASLRRYYAKTLH
jgi:PIN domain nuclease of toxin-antitoxin system